MTTPRVTVPVEPTVRMLSAGAAHMRDDALYTPNSVWSAMLSAAPAAPQAAGVGERGVAGVIMDGLWPILGGNHTDAEVWNEIGAVVSSALRAPSRKPEGGAGSCFTDIFLSWHEESGTVERAGYGASPIGKFQARWPDLHKRLWDAGMKSPAAMRDEWVKVAKECAMATREEAPAEAGEVDEDWVRGLIGEAVHMKADDIDEDSEELSRISEAVLDAIRPYLRAQPQAREEAQPVAICDGVEQPAFEEWASKQGFDMNEHPLHYLFLDAKTDAARQAWKAGMEHAVGRMATHPAPDALQAEQKGGA